MPSYEQWRAAAAGERLPAAFVDLDAFDRNVEAVARLVTRARGPGAKVRVATKSLRVPELIERVLKRGAPFQGLMVASAEEAAFLASRGLEDLLVAYPTPSEADLAALRELHVLGRKVALVADSEEGLARTESAMRGVKEPFPVVLEADVSLRAFGLRLGLGVLRSPVWDGHGLLSLVRGIKARPSLKFKGVMAYEAFVAGVADQNPFQGTRNPLVRLLRRLDSRAVHRKRRAIAELLAREGAFCELFNGGGTGSLSFAAHEPWLTELTAGSAFLCPLLFDYYTNLAFEPACVFALPVVRFPGPGIATCLGGGYVASGEPGRDRVPRPFLPEGARLTPHEAAGEVQTPVLLPPGSDLKPGDPVFFRHAKAGELAEHFNEYVLVSGGRPAGRAKTYRGLGKSFY